MIDYIVIGAGSGGLASAIYASKLNKKVLVIENSDVGGTCVNRGCIPKKVFWNAANFIRQLPMYNHYGVVSSPIMLTPAQAVKSWENVVKMSHTYISNIQKSYMSALSKNNITYVRGVGKIMEKGTVIVVDEHEKYTQYTCPKILLATGARPIRVSFNGKYYGITSDDFFSLKSPPKSVLIVGAGYIAAELATILSYFKSDVHLACRYARILRSFDTEIVDKAMSSMLHSGIIIHTFTSIHNVVRKNGRYSVSYTKTLDDEKFTQCLDVDEIIWAIGRETTVESAFSGDFTVKLVGREKFVEVDSFYQTSVKGIYAVGDIIDSPSLTPVAIKAGRLLADYLFNPHTSIRKPIYPLEYVPTSIYTMPPVASMGLSEQDALQKYPNVVVYKSVFMNTLYAAPNTISNEDAKKNMEPNRTMFKLVCYADSPSESLSVNHVVVGVHLHGDNSDEIIQGFASLFSCMKTVSKSDLDSTIALHPTAAEEIVTMKTPIFKQSTNPNLDCRNPSFYSISLSPLLLLLLCHYIQRVADFYLASKTFSDISIA